MANFIDLRNKVHPQVKVIYRTIVQRRPWYMELTKIALAVVIVGTAVWGISRADTPEEPVVVKSFSAAGLVEAVSNSSISINNARGADGSGQDGYTFDTKSIKKIETRYYDPIDLNDIEIGDKIVVQGTETGGAIKITRIISFSKNIPLREGVRQVIEPELNSAPEIVPVPEVATSTATSTPTADIDVASTTDEQSTTTPSIVDVVIDAVQEIIETVTDIINPNNGSSTDSADVDEVTQETDSESVVEEAESEGTTEESAATSDEPTQVPEQ